MWGEYILASNKTTNLELKLIQPTDKFINVTFNDVINDIDSKCLSVDHAKSPAHFSVWKKATNYAKDDIIRITKGKSNQYYQCIVGGTSGATEPENNVTGSIVTDGSVKWKVCEFGAGSSNNSLDLWVGNTYYTRGQIVLYNNEIFRCKIDHTSLNTFAQDKINFQQLFSNVQEWKDGVLYQEHATVVYNNRIYKCITEHTSTTTFDKTKFDLLDIYGLVDEYAKNTEYQKGQVVTYQGTYYVANANFTSGNTNFIDDIANFNLLYASVNDWTYPKHYPLNVVVIKDGLLYKCVSAHTSTSNFETDRAKWKLLGNVPAYLNNWQSSTYYYTGQCVLVDGIIYRSKTDHTSDATSFDNETNSWEIVGGVGGANEWQVNKPYQVGQFVIYKDILYRCNAKHTSNTTDFQTDIAKWDIVYANIPNWASGVYYKAGTIIKYDNLFFINSAGHTSSSNFETDRSKWTLLSNVLANLQAWVANKYYYEGQCIVNGNTIYRCKTAHMSATNWDNDNADWETIGGGTLNTWTAATMYLKDDIVIHNNKLYQCLLAHKANNDFNHDYKNNYWQEISKTQIDDWTSSTHYYIGDLVLKDAQIYRCIKNNDSSTDFKVDYETDGDWELVSPTVDEITDWTANKEYKKDQLVLHNNLLYRCKVLHTSTTDFDVDYSNNDWVQLCSATILDWATPHKYEVGDIVRYENNLYRCVKLHTSTSFNADVANWQLIGTINIASTWTKQTLYLKGQVVYYDEKSYVSTETHISGNNFESDAKYFINRYSNIKPFKQDTYYKTGDTVIFNKNIYRCLSDHLENNDNVTNVLVKNDIGGTHFENYPAGIIDIDKTYVLDLGSLQNIYYIYWKYNGGFMGVAEQTVSVSSDNTTYKQVDYYYDLGAREGQNNTIYINDTIRYIKFHATKIHNLGGGSLHSVYKVYAKNPLWELLYNIKSNFSYWKTSTDYDINDCVTYNNNQYICTQTHNSGNTFLPDKWKQIDKTITLWDKGIKYYIGDIALYNNVLYRCIKDHISKGSFKDDIDNWELLNSNITNWKENITYKLGEIVLYHNNLYQCTEENTDDTFVNKRWKPVSRNIALWENGNDETLKALLHFDETETKDEIGNVWTKTGTLAINQNQHKFDTGSSLGISSASSYIEYSPFHDLYTLTGSNQYDCTIGFWLNTSSTASNIVDILGDKINPTSYPQYIVGKWNHIEIDITANIKKIYINGNFVGTDTNNTNSSAGIKIGILDNVSEVAYIDDLSIYNRVLHTTDFSVPTERVEAGKYYNYDVGDYIEHNHAIYRCIEENNDITFDATKWETMSTIITVDDWKPNTDYSLHEIVQNHSQLLRCIDAHRSGNAYDDTEETSWEVLGGSIDNWQPHKQYGLGNIVLYQDTLYRCSATHVSGAEFNDTSQYFVALGADSTGNYSGYRQLSKMNVVAPKQVDISIPKSKSFKLPPVEILKLKQNIASTVELSSFDNGGDYNCSEEFLVFNGVVKLKTKYIEQIPKDAVNPQDYIDTSKYKSVQNIDTSDSGFIKYEAVPKAQIIKDKNLKPIGDYTNINSITINSSASGNANVRFAITKDGNTYYTYNNGFAQIDVDNDIGNIGMTQTVFSNIPISDLLTFISDSEYIGFAYYLDIQSLSDTAEIDSIIINVTSNNWKKAVHGTDYDYGYTSQRTLQVDLLTDGSYKINYPVPDAEDNIESDWATKRQARGYAISLG